MNDYVDERMLVANACRVLAVRGLVDDILGHVSLRVDDDTVLVHPSERGTLKQELLKVGWPADDRAGYVDGEAHPISLTEDGWTLRPYQQQAVDGFWDGGSGVVVLPCGAGKTMVGAAAMARAQATTLILVTNTVAGRQWKRELIARTRSESAIAHAIAQDRVAFYTAPIKALVSEKFFDLCALFGADNVAIDDHLPGAEGEEFRGVVLFAKDPQRRARLAAAGGRGRPRPRLPRAHLPGRPARARRRPGHRRPRGARPPRRPLLRRGHRDARRAAPTGPAAQPGPHRARLLRRRPRWSWGRAGCPWSCPGFPG